MQINFLSIIFFYLQLSSVKIETSALGGPHSMYLRCLAKWSHLTFLYPNLFYFFAFLCKFFYSCNISISRWAALLFYNIKRNKVKHRLTLNILTLKFPSLCLSFSITSDISYFMKFVFLNLLAGEFTNWCNDIFIL